MKAHYTEKNVLAPAITLMIMAPLLTEILPGATRFSSLIVFPIEICVWGGGALLIRAIVRQRKLGWLNMLFLAMALAIAEEFLIQQTSLAPMVIRLKGVTYARAFGVNYVYLLWALIYEPVFAVLLPVYLVELIFPDQKESSWISRAGLFVTVPLFLLGSMLAWLSWTQIARTKVFHVAVYHPPPAAIAISLFIIIGLIYLAIVHFKKAPFQNVISIKPPLLWILFTSGAMWSVLLYVLVALAFGILPNVPPYMPVCLGIILIVSVLFFLPRWAADLRWRSDNTYRLISGTILGSMLAGFLGFFGSSRPDLYFKIITNIIALLLMVTFGMKIQESKDLFKIPEK